MYSETGGPEVLRVVERAVPEPGPGEVRVRVPVSGVNPTDWKSRAGRAPGEALPFPEVVPNQDGAGTVDAVGEGVDAARAGERVWLWEAAWQRANGTAQEYVVLPERQAVALPEGVSFDVGASLGIPALTAHRCLTVSDAGPRQARPRNPGRSDGARRRRRGRGRPRGDPARPLGRRASDRDRLERGEGRARAGGGRRPHRRLPERQRGGRDPELDAGGSRHRRRGRAGGERAPRRGQSSPRTAPSRPTPPKAGSTSGSSSARSSPGTSGTSSSSSTR